MVLVHLVGVQIPVSLPFFGGLAEWSNAVVLKTTEPVMVPQVRILHPPPLGTLVFSLTSLQMSRIIDVT